MSLAGEKTGSRDDYSSPSEVSWRGRQGITGTWRPFSSRYVAVPAASSIILALDANGHFSPLAPPGLEFVSIRLDSERASQPEGALHTSPRFCPGFTAPRLAIRLIDVRKMVGP